MWSKLQNRYRMSDPQLQQVSESEITAEVAALGLKGGSSAASSGPATPTASHAGTVDNKTPWPNSADDYEVKAFSVPQCPTVVLKNITLC